MDEIVSRAVAVANSHQEYLRLESRLKVLNEMRDQLIDRGGCHREECDECHRSTIVTVDPETEDCGDFVMCLECVKALIAKVSARVRRLRQCSK